MKKFLLLCLGGCIFAANFAHAACALDTLPDLERYVAQFPEAPRPAGSGDFQNLDFSSYYARYFNITFWSKVLSFFGFCCSLLDMRDLKRMLVKATETLKQDPFPEKCTMPAGSHAIFFGDLNGALHSFTRDLLQLKETGVLNNDFTLQNPETKLVFLGNILSFSPHSLELLFVLLLLFDRNPGQVIFLQGSHEQSVEWENFDVRDELQIRASDIAVASDRNVPMRTAINNFFACCAPALELYAQDKDGFIYCTYSDALAHKLKSRGCKVIIEGAARIKKRVCEKHGADFIGFDHGISIWAILSSPVYVFQSFYNFYYDAFAQVTFADSIQKSTITVETRDVRKDDPFSKKTYDLIYGVEREPGQPALTGIRFGSLMPLSGRNYFLAIAEVRAYDALLDEMKKSGGIHGAFPHPYVFDDLYDPYKTRLYAEEFVDKLGIDMIVRPSGTPTLLSYLDLVKKGKLSVFFPLTGAPVFRDIKLKNVLHFRPTYEDEVNCLVNHVLDVYRSRKFALFYQNDSYGIPPLLQAHEILKKRGITEWVDIPYDREQLDFSKQAAALEKANPEAIAFFCITGAAESLIEKVGPAFFWGRHSFALSIVYSDKFKRFLLETGTPFTFSFVAEDAKTSDLEIVKEYRAGMDAFGYPYSQDSLATYIALKMFVHALEKVGPPYTKERVMAFFESLKNYSFKGLILTFNPKRRDLSQPVFLETEKGTFVSCAAGQ